MSTVKISQLPFITSLNANTEKTLMAGVDLPTGITGKISVRTLAKGLFSNDVLNVGINPIVYDNVIAQFTGSSTTYLQSVIKNTNGVGSSDFVAYANNSSGSNNFIDMGINGAGFNDPLYTSMKPYDGYLFNYGPSAGDYRGNLVIGTSSSSAKVKFIAGGTLTANIVGQFDKSLYEFYNPLNVTGDITSTGNVHGTSIHFSDGSIQTTSLTTRLNAAFLKANNALANTSNGIFGYNLTVPDTLTANVLIVTGAQQFSSNGIIQTTTGTGNFKNITLLTGVETSSGNSGSIDISTGSGGSVSGRGGHISLTPGSGATGKGEIFFNANVSISNNLTISGNTNTAKINTENLSVVGTANVSGALNVVGAITGNAQVVLQNTQFSATQSALTISASPTVATPSNDGYMIHVSGKTGVTSRIVNDSYGTGAYALYAGRAARGTVSSPTALQSGDVISRFSGNGYGATKYQPLGVGRIDFVATENYTDTSTGSAIQFWNCPTGSNTLTNIATFNGDSVEFTGSVKPEKGFVYTPRILIGAQTAITVDFTNDSIIKSDLTSNLTLSFTNYLAGKIVEVWLTNTGGTNRTVTHGCSATNSSENATTFTIPATSSAYIRYFSIDGDLANTFVTVIHA
jgi:hypothetical protein